MGGPCAPGSRRKGSGRANQWRTRGRFQIGALAAFAQYRGRVAALADAYVGALTEEGLAREVKLGERTETVGESINLHLAIHLNGHRGEINLLRGMMGFEPVLLNQGG